eukprot:scaffold197225_cov46-Attheya_sp.AAC.1
MRVILHHLNLLVAVASVILDSRCCAFSVATRTTSNPILTASSPGDPTQFDSGCVANPVILAPSENNPKWQCYYYGNAGSWSGGRPCFLPTGSSGLAESIDGITWSKVSGSEEDGAILTPGQEGEWDAVQTGVADVVRVGQILHMYYFGGSDEEISMGPGAIAGFRMRIGRASSTDGGRTWVKDDSVLFDYDESEGFFASWPRIVTSTDEPWKMFYHAFNGKKWRVFGAESSDQGDSWKRTGLVIEGSDEEEGFDFQGIGTRAVVPWRDGLLMIYEGVAKSGTHSLGAAYCDGNNSWCKLNDGNPILEPGKGALGEWSSQVIGTPYVVVMDDGSLRVYHCGKNGPAAKMSIGVVESKSGDIGPDCWQAISTSNVL